MNAINTYKVEISAQGASETQLRAALNRFIDATQADSDKYRQAITEVKLNGPPSVVALATNISDDFADLENASVPPAESVRPIPDPTEAGQIAIKLIKDIAAFTTEAGKYSGATS